MSQLTVQLWVGIATGTIALVGLIITIARAAASWVRSQSTLTNTVGELTDYVKRIDVRVETYISGEDRRDESMETWRRTVDGRLSSIEATLGMLSARSGRRRTDRRE